jgi:hypothetical protein
MNYLNCHNVLRNSKKKVGNLDMPVSLKLWFLRRYREVSIVLGLSILALGIYVFGMTYSTDDYVSLLRSCNMTASGRWACNFMYNYLCMKNYLPILSPIAGMTAMALAGFELTRLWRIRNFTNRVLVMAFFSLYPYVLDMYNFRIIAVAFPWAYYFALLALNQRKGWVGAILFCISLGIYQAALGAAACAWLMALLFRLHANGYRLNKPLLRRHLQGWGWIILGIAGYLLIMKMTLMGGPANSRIEAGFFGDDPLRNFLKYSFILLLRLSFIPEYVIPLAPKIGVFLCVVLGTGIILIQSKLRWWVVFILIMLPFAAIAHILPLANPYVPWRISFGLIVFTAGLLGMILQHKKLHKAGQVLGLFLIISFVIVDNARMFEQYIQNQRDIAMANRIACRIESLSGYTPGMKFIIVGDTGPASLTWNRKFTFSVIKDSIDYYSRHRFGMGGCFETEWSKYAVFCNFLQLPLIPTGPDSEKAAQRFIQTRISKPWPHPSSVFIADDAVILFLGPSQVGEKNRG